MDKMLGYLVAEFPVVSETFVYREMRSLKDRKYQLHLYTLRHVGHSDGVDLSGLPESKSVYGRSVVYFLVEFFRQLLVNSKAMFNALGMLLEDMRSLPRLSSKIKLIGQFLAATNLAKQLVEDGVNHLHVHFIHSPTQIAMYACTMASIPFTVTAHANDIYSQGQLLTTKAKRASRLLTISEFNRRYFESLGIAPEKIGVMRCILDLPKPSESEPSKGACFRFGSLGRLVPKKGFATLIEAFHQLVELRPEINAKLEIAGGGAQKQELESLVIRLGLTDKVKLLGPLHQTKVIDWMSGLSCFVLACEEDKSTGDVDGIPVVLMEAMSCKVPVISTEVSGIPELVVNETTGLLSRPGDSRSLSQAMLRLIEAPDLSSQLVSQATTHIDQEFSKEINIKRLIHAFSGVNTSGTLPEN